LANPSQYAFTDEQVATIVTILQKTVNEVQAAFTDPKAAKSEGFTLG